MKYHVVLSRHFDLEQFEQDAQADRCPRHTLRTLSQQLGATVHDPSEYLASVTTSDRILSKLTGGSQPEHWAMARALSQKLTREDIVFSVGEDSGYPIAILCGTPKNGPKISVMVHNADRLRARLTLKLFNLANRIDLFITNTAFKADYLRQYLSLPAPQVFLVDEQTDTRFFTPGPQSPNKTRPIIGSGGLEQRDYRTLAKATQDLDVDVKVSAVSPNAKVYQDTFPEEMPANMSCDYYDWQNLRQLYRDADVVVVSLKDHSYQAGFTTLFEALACRRPVVMTRTPGLAEKFADAGMITGVQPEDTEGMKQAICHLLEHPDLAEQQAQRGYELVQEHYNSEQYVNSLAEQLISLAETKQAPVLVS
jgi:glycosyltransferase involved in cell wall biosynthesis